MIDVPNFLGDLANPSCFRKPIGIESEDLLRLIDQLKLMVTIRKAEEKIADAVTAGIVHCPCHLAIGQEAIAVGVSENLTTTDRVFGGHRSHAHYLAQGGNLYGLFAEVLGRVTGCSKGMGGSMHLYGADHGFVGSVPIVAGTIPLAVGAGLACQKRGKKEVAVSYFGDGSAEEGVVHESLNFAANFSLPVLFVCENNLFSSHLHIELRQPATSVARYAVSHLIPYEVVDGNDVVAVRQAAARLIKRSRAGEGPGFLEAVTYRWRGHVGPSEDLDVGIKRREDVAQWKLRDPIDRLKLALIASHALSEEQWDCLTSESALLVDEAWTKALIAPLPSKEATLAYVYKTGMDS